MSYYRDFFPRIAEKPNPFYKMLKTKVPINITSELKKTFDSVNKALSDACELALKQPIPGKHFALLTDASLRSAGYALMIEDNPDQKTQLKRKRTPLWRLAQKLFPPRNSNCLNAPKNFWQITWHFLSLHTYSDKQQSQQLYSPTTNPFHVFSKRRQFREDCEMHVSICFSLTSKLDTLLVQSTLRLIFSTDWTSKSRRRYVSKSGKISKQYPSK